MKRSDINPLPEYFDRYIELVADVELSTAFDDSLSQLNEFDYVRAVRGLNQFRGALAAKCQYAEVFQSISLSSAR